MARTLSLDNQVPLVIDDFSGFKNDFFYRRNRLGALNTHYIPQKMPFLNLLYKFYEKVNSEALRRVLETKNYFKQKKNALFYETSLNEKIKRKIINKPVYVFGYWQNEKYFSHQKNILTKELTPKNNAFKNTDIFKKISLSESVAIHFRKNHNTSLKGKKKNNTGKNLTLPAEYYIEAIEKILKIKKNPHFFCFGDETTQADIILGKTTKKTIVNFRDNCEDNDIRDLFLMSCCSSFILSNSTFCWWAAWLSKRQDKTVICPNPDRYFGCGATANGWTELK